LNYTDSALGELTDLVARAKELAIGQANDPSSNAVTRMAVSSEIDQLFNQAVNIGNRKFGERFIFGGFRTTHSPFDHTGKYLGDEGAIQIETNKGVYTSINLPGDAVFHGRNDVLTNVPENRRGSTTPNYPGPVTPPEPDVQVRGPASINERRKTEEDEKVKDLKEEPAGQNIFHIFRALSNGLKTNDTVAIEDTLERLDSGLEQVVLLRSQIGSRSAALENSAEGLAKNKIEDATLLSSIEDADAFEVFTDITKNENTLKATLQTSGKLIQPSLLDFLR
jgi:flagellar hook-associated protein 3 FlgL